LLLTERAKSYFDQIIENDSINLEISKGVLSKNLFLDLLEEPITLFDSMVHEYNSARKGSHASSNQADMKAYKETDKNTLMRVVLLQMARDEYCHAISHLLRGHATAIFGHLRTFTENAGVAYLSKTDRELGTLFFDSSPEAQNKYRSKTMKKKVFRDDDPIVAELRAFFDNFSRMFHSNFISFVMRGDVSVTREDDEVRYKVDLNFHDAAKHGEIMYLLYCTMITDLAERCLRVFSAAFSLPDCVWYRRIDLYHDRKVAVIRSNKELMKHVALFQKQHLNENLDTP
jgi:hypothetical protein